MYLDVGGKYEDLLSMCYWDFLNILDTRKELNLRRSGKPIVKNKVPQSNKDMIQRMKDTYGKGSN